MASAGQQAGSRPLDSCRLLSVPERLPFIPRDAAIYNPGFGFLAHFQV
jgi:hypothetical protein